MHGTPAAAVLALLCALSPVPGDLKTVKSDTGTWEYQAPEGYTVEEPKKANIDSQIAYSGAPYLSSKIKVYSYDGYAKAEHLANLMKFFEQSIGGNITYEGDQKHRFTSDLQFSGIWWISQIEGRVESGRGYVIECLVPKDTYDATKEVWTAVADSFKTFPPAPDPFTVPAGWTVNKNAMFAVLGPMGDLKDKKTKDLLQRRLAQVQLLLDVDQPATKLYRAVFSDERKAFSRCPVHVQPTEEGFKAEAGDRWAEGVHVLYLPDHPERILLVDGSADGGFRDEDLLTEAGVQYVESRLGKTWPWLRAAFRLYYAAGLKSRALPGLFPNEMLKRAKEVFGKSPATFDDLMKKDEAGMAALGDEGRIAAWGLLQYGLHGPDGPTREIFRALLRDGVGAPDLSAVWEKCLARHKEETKKVFKTKDLDSGARKYFRDMKEEKK